MEPLANKPKILKKNIDDGYVIRYFVRHVSSRTITEIDQEQYNIFKTNRLYETVTIKWFIVGSDAIDKNTATIGLYTDPEKFIISVSQNTPTMLIGLRGMLRSPKEFVIT